MEKVFQYSETLYVYITIGYKYLGFISFFLFIFGESSLVDYQVWCLLQPKISRYIFTIYRRQAKTFILA